MTQLNAKTKNIQDIFQQKYVIPEYQRRYSWDKEQCLQLVDDLQAFHKSGEDGEYFLGCIVIAKDDKGWWDVIDGQQRLITISLLIRTLLDKAEVYVDLRKCLQKTNPRTGDFIDELYLTSKVVEEDNEKFKDILLNKSTNSNNRFSTNYGHLKNAIEDIFPDGTELEEFIQTLLKRTVLLPIECNSVESALTIFQTLNDRGMSLADADIFKATLYAESPCKEEFINNWNLLQKQTEEQVTTVDQFFRIYMHILRAENKDTTKEIGLRSYFKKEQLVDPAEVMQCLRKCQAVDYWQSSPTITVWWEVLKSYPNSYWQYPLYIFLNRHGEYDDQGFSVSRQNEEKFIELLEETVRYCYIKGVVNNSVNTIKDTIFRVCVDIQHDGDYKSTYNKNSEGDKNAFKERLNSSGYGRYQRGLVVLGSALYPIYPNPRNPDGQGEYAKMLEAKYQIEHILPRAWNDYDGWDDESHKRDIDKIGNLIPIERKLNIRASNEFFARKKEKGYKDSKNPELKELCKLEKWRPEDLQKRHAEVNKRLVNFFMYLP